MTNAVLAMNAGSSSIKFGLFGVESENAPVLLARGLLEDKADKPRLVVKDSEGNVLEDRLWQQGASHSDLLAAMLDWIETHFGSNNLLGVGHRVVHGGGKFVEPVSLNDETIGAIADLTPLAPLHQPRSLEPIRALKQLYAGLPQVASFDTAFHHRLAPPVSRYGLPRALESKGIRKYGFHGISYEYIAHRLGEIGTAALNKRTVVAHLGSGASLCAMKNGRSIDTTMGFTALDGLVMGTRCGSLDPGIILHLLRSHGLSADQIETLLYRHSGILGVSEQSSDMRELSASDDPRAREAIELFTFRIAREAAALAATMGGVEAFVFTGGIGENSSQVREEVCARLAWLGVELDPKRFGANALDLISAPHSSVDVRMIPTDEECMIALHTIALL